MINLHFLSQEQALPIMTTNTTILLSQYQCTIGVVAATACSINSYPCFLATKPEMFVRACCPCVCVCVCPSFASAVTPFLSICGQVAQQLCQLTSHTHCLSKLQLWEIPVVSILVSAFFLNCLMFLSVSTSDISVKILSERFLSILKLKV